MRTRGVWAGRGTAVTFLRAGQSRRFCPPAILEIPSTTYLPPLSRVKKKTPQVRTYNLREVKPLRNLDPQHIDQMVALRGMVIRTSQIIPDLKQAFFRCIVCNASKEVHTYADFFLLVFRPDW